MQDDNHHILDVRMAELANGYPCMTEESGLQLCRLWYVLQRQFSPPIEDFELITKDDGKNETWLFGPQVIYYPTKRKKELHILVVSKFIASSLKLDVSEKNMESQHLFFSDAKKQSFFIKWKLWKEETWNDLRTKFHQSQKFLCPDMFICVGPRLTADALVCDHSKTLTEQQAIEEHITVCLSKKIGDHDQTNTWNHPWRNKNALAVERKDSKTALEFAVQHPYLFRYTLDSNHNVIYTPGRDFIPLTDEEQENALTKEQKEWFFNIQHNVTEKLNDSWKELELSLRKNIRLIIQMYQKLGYDTFEFIRYEDFVLPELLKLFVQLPLPRLGLFTSCTTPEIRKSIRDKISTAYSFPTIVTLCCPDKKKKERVLFMRREDEHFMHFLKQFKIPSTNLRSFDTADAKYLILEHEPIIYQFLREAAKDLYYPIEYLIDHDPELISATDPRIKFFSPTTKTK